MGFLTEWITNIILFILLATILELLIPNSSMQRYVKMVVGLLLLLLILNPLLSIFRQDMNEWLVPLSNSSYSNEFEIENSIENKKIEIERGQRAYISKQVAVQLKRQVEEDLLQRFSMKVAHMEISLDELAAQTEDSEIIEHIWLSLRPVDDVSKEEGGIKSVPVVSIDTQKPIERKEELEELSEVQSFLSEVWQIPSDSISLVWEGGES